jgi:hypothetical protein
MTVAVEVAVDGGPDSVVRIVRRGELEFCAGSSDVKVIEGYVVTSRV